MLVLSRKENYHRAQAKGNNTKLIYRELRYTTNNLNSWHQSFKVGGVQYISSIAYSFKRSLVDRCHWRKQFKLLGDHRSDFSRWVRCSFDEHDNSVRRIWQLVLWGYLPTNIFLADYFYFRYFHTTYIRYHSWLMVIFCLTILVTLFFVPFSIVFYVYHVCIGEVLWSFNEAVGKNWGAWQNIFGSKLVARWRQQVKKKYSKFRLEVDKIKCLGKFPETLFENSGVSFVTSLSLLGKESLKQIFVQFARFSCMLTTISFLVAWSTTGFWSRTAF